MHFEYQVASAECPSVASFVGLEAERFELAERQCQASNRQALLLIAPAPAQPRRLEALHTRAVV